MDEIPVLAVLATTTAEGIDFDDVGELRVKESDRIAAIAANLRAMGAECVERAGGFFVPGARRCMGLGLRVFTITGIAMAFAVAALVAEGDSVIADAECAAISFPDFFDLLDKFAER